MGLIDYLRQRGYVWSWRVRYWWCDTRQGHAAHVGAFVLSVLVLVAQMVRMAVAAVVPGAAPEPEPEPERAVYWWVVQLVIMIVAAAISYALRPKTEPPQEQDPQPPQVQDGRAVVDYLGTHWIDHDEWFRLAWKVMGRVPIKTKSGKK